MIISSIALFTCGYVAAALAYYFNHRYIFHGKAKGPRFIKRLWKKYALLHSMHHAHWKPGNGETAHWLRVPWYGKIAGALIIALMWHFLSLWAALGILAFFIVYGIKHGSIHGYAPKPFKSKFPLELKEWKSASHAWKHHMSHHLGAPNVNHSGVHPFIDRLFGTYQDPDDILSESRRLR